MAKSSCDNESEVGGIERQSLYEVETSENEDLKCTIINLRAEVNELKQKLKTGKGVEAKSSNVSTLRVEIEDLNNCVWLGSAICLYLSKSLKLKEKPCSRNNKTCKMSLMVPI